MSSLRRFVPGVAALSFIGPAVPGQIIVNPGFETGTLAPWVVTHTAAGVSIGTGVSMFDMDGPSGAFPSSNAARFLVGRTGPSLSGWEGAELAQTVDLQAGETYRLRMHWAVRPLVNVYSQSGGRFELLVDGAVIQTHTAPSTAGLQPSYGFLHAAFTPGAGGPHDVGVRITRTVLAGEEVFQYIDHTGLTREACYADCNGDGLKTVQDFGCFQTRFALGDAYADANLDGQFTVQDFGAWQTVFVTSVSVQCP